MLPFYLHSSRPRLGALTADQASLARQLRSDVEVLATDIGPRGTFAPERYRLAESFLTAALDRAGFDIRRQAWTAMGVECANLEVRIPGTDVRAAHVVVGAHYDSVQGCPAANDNGSGVAGLLAMCRALKGRRTRATVRLVFFANEEPPFFNMSEMGSQLYAQACRKARDDIRGMFSLETIGCFSSAPRSQRWPHPALRYVLPSVGDFIAFVGPNSAKPFMAKCAKAFKRQRAFPLLAAGAPGVEQVNWSDHRGFIEVGYPAFMVTDTAPFRYGHYHLPTDTPEKLDYESMARVVEGLIGVVTAVAGE